MTILHGTTSDLSFRIQRQWQGLVRSVFFEQPTTKLSEQWKEKTEKRLSDEKNHVRKESNPQPFLALLPLEKVTISRMTLGVYGCTFSVSLGGAWKENTSFSFFKDREGLILEDGEHL